MWNFENARAAELSPALATHTKKFSKPYTEAQHVEAINHPL